MTGMATFLAILSFGSAQPARTHIPPIGTGAPRVVEVRMVDKGGGQWRFEPGTVRARRGDTVRFVQTDVVPHNVQFKDLPDGANLGGAVMGPFLLKKGDTYDLVIDDRFSAGSYHFVCTPHEAMGMKGTLEVSDTPGVDAGSPGS